MDIALGSSTARLRCVTLQIPTSIPELCEGLWGLLIPPDFLFKLFDLLLVCSYYALPQATSVFLWLLLTNTLRKKAIGLVVLQLRFREKQLASEVFQGTSR